MEVNRQNNDGSWSTATPLPYYPSIIEKILHWFGIHQLTYRKPIKCVMCGENQELAKQTKGNDEE